MKKILFLLILWMNQFTAHAQSTPIDSSKYPRLTTFTTQQDHDNMMQQLGITKLRPGPSGNESAPNHANYDESLANPCPQLPDILTMKNGTESDNCGSVVETTPTRVD
jgi:hypothetical protein